MKVGVVVFPGSNCDHDAWYAINRNLQRQTPVSSGTIPPISNGIDAVILPGGFSYGDYLRCGAIARFSPVMGAVHKFAADGGLGARHLQRIPDSGGSRPASRRAAAQSSI